MQAVQDQIKGTRKSFSTWYWKFLLTAEMTSWSYL